MKEVKFKVWDGVLMHSVSELHFCQGGIKFYSPGVGEGWCTSEMPSVKKTCELIQYTGAGDIYDGDILSNNYRTDREVLRRVEFLEGHWVMIRVKGKSSLPKVIPLYEHWQLNYKTVGNVYENPKLKGL